MANYYCVLFDADNTLLDFDAAERKALAETLTHFGFEANAATTQLYQEINDRLWRSLEKGEIRRDRIMAERFGRLLEKLGAPPTRGLGGEMNRYYLDQLATHADVLPDALEVLRELSEVATLAIVSNGVYAVQSARLEASGVADLMEDMFISEKVGADKPNRRIVDTALNTLGVENRAHVLLVGDGLGSDMQAARNAGVVGCWYNPLGNENTTQLKPEYEIRDLRELYQIVMEPEELTNVGSPNRKHRT